MTISQTMAKRNNESTCWHKRNSKLESFLKRSLPSQVYEDIRYYEGCIVKLPKEELAFKYVILTGQSLLLTDWPPRNVQEVVHLTDLVHIRVEHDFPEFLKGSQRDDCQHIRLSLRDKQHINPPLIDVAEEETYSLTESQHGSSQNSEMILESKELQAPVVSPQKQNGDTWNSELQSSSDPSSDQAQVHKTEAISSHHQWRTKITQPKVNQLNNGQRSNFKCSGNRSNTTVTTEKCSSARSRRRGMLETCAEERHQDCRQRWVTDPMKNRSLNSLVDRIGDNASQSCTVECECADLRLGIHVPQSKVISPFINGPNCRPYKSREAPDDNSSWNRELGPKVENVEERSISSLLRRIETAQPHIPRSKSSLDQHKHMPENSSTSVHAIPERRSYSSLDKPRVHHAKVESMIKFTTPFVQELELHLYVLQSSPSLLIQLQACWVTQLLLATLGSVRNSSVAALRDTDHLETVYHQFKRELVNTHYAADHNFYLMQELQIGLQNNSDLKRIFWKDQMLYHYIVQRLQEYLLDPNSSLYTNAMAHNEDPELMLSARQDELESAVLLLEILLIALRDTDNIHDKIQMLQFNTGSLLKSLLALLLTPPNIPQQLHNTCSRMLEDFHEFCSSGWSNLPEAELIKLMGEITNISTAIIYELLLTIGKLMHGNSAMSMSKLLEEVVLECHLKRSLTQLLGILYPSQRQQLKPPDVVLVYQHFYVLKCLMENISKVQIYIKEQFQEEFRYYIHWSRVNRKLPDNYPIKILVRELVDKVHQMAASYTYLEYPNHFITRTSNTNNDIFYN